MTKLFDDDTVSSNESAFVNLLAGKHAYRIVKATLASKDDTDASGRPIKTITGVNVAFEHLTQKTRHTHHYAVAAPGDRGRIAKGDMKALWQASKLQGDPGLDRLPNFTDKTVEIEAIHTSPNEQGKVFANIRMTLPYDGPVPSSSNYNQPEDPDDKINTDPSPNDTASAPPAETPAPANPAPAKKWAGRKK